MGTMGTSQEHDEMDECVQALARVHSFLHNELVEADADAIRVHLHACERCMENFEIETTITEMIVRSQPVQQAPAALAARIQTMRLTRR
ncbi:mycothiol system anti-sigma-R factor [Tessaracoccus bendigoensis DSM 12906]|uniref:Mycothiol system anti-sigma-R factor n=1 Tax=Tessaracoccus bendigoensis DSM 12906 TaxID=1123357 RepID=A0A1M6GEE5_9ACTN|nr:zf-HC2 domain-containing protein [Tessaracoccus bendigoensis]SHJ08241.1 mycothiol system anti-sigma-R factor [Tessaracoccus bendigoensis DSM 12906]